MAGRAGGRDESALSTSAVMTGLAWCLLLAACDLCVAIAHRLL
jgi:hypothetical protein